MMQLLAMVEKGRVFIITVELGREQKGIKKDASSRLEMRTLNPLSD